jgi:2-methylcitrate dehydratase PrpD
METVMSSQALANALASCRYRALPPETVQSATWCLVDTLAAVYAAVEEFPIHRLREFWRADGMRPGGPCRLIGTGTRVPGALAALVHSAMAQSLEMDDFHKQSIVHIGSTVVPPALAAAERLGRNGRDLLTAIVVGYEAGIRAGEAVNPAHHRIWHSTGTCGTFGAAAAVGKLLGLAPAAMNNALGTAGTQAAGMNQYMIDGGEMSKPLHAGKAGLNGYLAAMLAAKGFTGATRIFEGDKGFLRATTSAPHPEAITTGLDQRSFPDRITRVTRRLFPVNGHILSPLEGLLTLRETHQIRAAQVQAVEIALYAEAYNFLQPVRPTSPFLARFCLPFCVAVAVLDGEVTPQSFGPRQLKRQDLRQFMSRVRTREDPNLTAAFPARWSSEVTVELVDGTRHTACVEIPKGDPSNALSRDDLATKFLKSVGSVIGPRAAQRLLDRCLDVRRLDRVGDLWRGLPWGRSRS